MPPTSFSPASSSSSSSSALLSAGSPVAVLASTRYDQDIEYLEKNQPKNEELRRYRVQAAKLLQRAEPPKVENVPMKVEKKSPSKK